MLGGAVRPEARERRVAGDRGGHDHVALVAGHQSLQVDVQTVDDAPEVHPQQPVPVGHGQVHHVATAGHASVQADDLGRSEGSVGVGGEPAERVDVGYIAQPTEHLGASGGQFCDRCGQGSLLDVGDRHQHSGGGETMRECEAHAGCAARDDGDLVLQVLHGCSPVVKFRGRAVPAQRVQALPGGCRAVGVPSGPRSGRWPFPG